MRTFRGFIAFCMAGLFAGSIAGLYMFAPAPLHAQLSAQQTFVPASQVGGSANAITLSLANITQLSDILGVPIHIIPTNTNAAGGTTITPATGLGAINVLRSSGGTLVPIAGGDITAGATPVIAEVIYDGTEFVLTDPATGTALVGSEVDFTAGSAAPAGHLIEDGRCISQTTYLSLWNYYGNSDIYSPGSTGGVCSAGQFHIKFANGRASVAYDTQGTATANILTNAGSGCAATAVAVDCGNQAVIIAQTGLPNSTIPIPAGQGAHTHTFNSIQPGGGSTLAASGAPVSDQGATTASATLPAMVTSSINGGVTQTTTPVIQPLSTVMKAVKY